MPAVIHRAIEASVHIGGYEHARIRHGFVALVGFASGDANEEFEGPVGKMA